MARNRYDMALGKKVSKAEKEKATREKARRDMTEATALRSLRSTPRTSRNPFLDMVNMVTTEPEPNIRYDGSDQAEVREVRRISPVRPHPQPGRITSE